MHQILPRSEINGVFQVPGDKSISHRALLLATLAKGKSIIKNLNPGLDVMATLSYLKKSHIPYEMLHDEIHIYGQGGGSTTPKSFDCGNSGTTLSLLMGVVKGEITFSGDESLKSRSFQNKIEVLKSLGYSFTFFDKPFHVPFKMTPSFSLPEKFYYEMPIASAQLKSMLLLLFTRYNKELHLTEKFPTRDHTERLLKKMTATNRHPGDPYSPLKLTIPGDFSLAAYFITAALLARKAHIVIKDVNLNPTRLGFYKIVKKMGGKISLKYKNRGGEPIGDIEVFSSNLKGITVPKELIPSLIDELPCLALLALKTKGKTIVTGAMRLRNKECDRIKAIYENLKICGADIKELDDGFIIKGNKPLKINECLKSFQDHRIVMMLSLFSFIYKYPFYIDDIKWTQISYPSFFKELHDYCN